MRSKVKVHLLGMAMLLALISGCQQMSYLGLTGLPPSEGLTPNVRIGNGYSEIHTAEETSDGWGGIYYGTYVYYKGKPICRCGRDEIAISPKGEYAVYYNLENDKLELFNSKSRKVTTIITENLGYPFGGEWDVGNEKAVIYLDKPGAVSTESKIEISLFQ